MTHSFEKNRILIAGDVMLDRYWFGDVHRISPEAPVPIIRIKNREDRLGGAANVAHNASALGAMVSLLGIVGQDEAGDSIQRLLEQSNIAHYLQQDSTISTIIKLRVIGRQQQLLRIDFEELPADVVLKNKFTQFEVLLPKHDIVIFSDYEKGSLANISEMITMAKYAGKKTLVDPKGEVFSRYKGASILTPNQAELKQVVGSWRDEAHLSEKAHQLKNELELEALLLTRSEKGISLYTDQNDQHFPAVAQEVYDVSGAGDTVIATMAVMLSAGMSLAESAAFANRAAGIVVGKLGTATVKKEDLFRY